VCICGRKGKETKTNPVIKHQAGNRQVKGGKGQEGRRTKEGKKDAETLSLSRAKEDKRAAMQPQLLIERLICKPSHSYLLLLLPSPSQT